jgi:hypothetical protein
MVDPALALLLHRITLFAYVPHVGAGALALVSGMIAAFARKGDPIHRRAGTVFFGSMLVMAVFAAYLAVAVPHQTVTLLISTFTFYLVATAWITVRRRPDAAGLAEKIALLVIVCLCLPFAVLTFEVATGAAPQFRGPVLIAIYAFALVMVIAAVSDARVVLAGGISGPPRIARHLWRMCLGLTLATGSAFTNGLARFLPGPYHVPPVFFFPQFLPLGLLIFWMIRVRLTGWRPRGEAGPPV